MTAGQDRPCCYLRFVPAKIETVIPTVGNVILLLFLKVNAANTQRYIAAGYQVLCRPSISIYIYIYIFILQALFYLTLSAVIYKYEKYLRELFCCLILKHLTEERRQVAVSGAHSEVVFFP